MRRFVLLMALVVLLNGCGSGPQGVAVPAPLPPAGGVGISEQTLRAQFPAPDYEFSPGEECGRPCLTGTYKGKATAVIKGYGPTEGFSEVTFSIDTKADAAGEGEKVMMGVLKVVHPEFADWLRTTMASYNYKLGEWQEKTLGNKSAVFTGSDVAGTKTIKIFVRLDQE